MNTAFEKDNFLSLGKLSANNHFYQEVFKRGERVASVVFYILSYIDTTEQTKVHRDNLSDKAMGLHEALITSLNLHEYEAQEGMHTLMHAVVALESALHLSAAARLITNSVESTIYEEIDTLKRIMKNHYLKQADEPYSFMEESTPKMPTPSSTQSSPSRPAPNNQRAETRPSFPGKKPAKTTTRTPDQSARLERIKTVLEAKGEATIKDIADVVNDCSEKTIQRDLNNLINQGVVKREGERRWSRYTISKS